MPPTEMRSAQMPYGARGGRRYGSVVAMAFLAAAPAVYFWPAALGRVLLAPGDALVYFMPMRELAAQYVRAGHLPLWNPFIFSGFPFLAESATAVLFPATWLFLVLPPLWATNVQMLGTFSIAGIGAYAYCRAIGSTPFGAAFGGLTFAFSGFMMGHLGHVGIVQAVVWLPVVLACLERLRHVARFRFVVAGAAAIALSIFAGHPQFPVYIGFVCVGYTAWFTVCGRPLIGRWRYAALGTVTLAGGALLAAVQLVPMAELAGHSVRAALTFRRFVEYSLPISQLPTLLVPFLFGGQWGRAYWGAWWDPFELLGYTGLIPVMLAIAAVPLARRDRVAQFWLLLAAISLLLALGDGTPLARLMYHLPVYSLFRAPARNLLGFDLALAVLSARTLSGLDPRARRAWPMAALAVLALVVLVAGFAVTAGERLWAPLAESAVRGGFANPQLHGALAIDNEALALPLVFAVLGAVAVAGLARWPSRWWQAGVLAIHCLDLAAFGQMVPHVLRPAAHAGEVPNFIEYVQSQERSPADYRLAAVTAGDYRQADNGYGLWQVPAITGYDPLMLSRYGALAGDMKPDGCIDDWVIATRPAFLDLLNAKYLLGVLPECQPAPAAPNGVGTTSQELHLFVQRGEVLTFGLPHPKAATAVGVVSFTSGAVVADGVPVARLRVSGQDGRVIERDLRAAEHTADWSSRPPDAAAADRHRRASVFESFEHGGTVGYKYLAHLDLPAGTSVTQVAIEGLLDGTWLNLSRLALVDASAGVVCPVTALHLLLRDADRWRLEYDAIGRVVIFRNRHVLPRAWLARTTVGLPADEVRRTLREGRFADGRSFDPRTVALVEDEPGRDFGAPDAAAEVRIVQYDPNAVVVQTRSAAPGFLVLSEVFYPDWTARVDGVEAPIIRTDYVLRGLALPAGTHRVEFAYRPRSVAFGATVTAATALVLAGIGAVRIVRRRAVTRGRV